MIADIDERQADGEITAIFAEVRDLWGVPYVSAIHRHMASRPGLLEWAWEALKPAFENGRAQVAAAAAAASPPLSTCRRRIRNWFKRLVRSASISTSPSVPAAAPRSLDGSRRAAVR